MKITTVHITTDAKKLWKCENYRTMHGEYKGRLPNNAGATVRVYLPPHKVDWCQEVLAWKVVNEDSRKINGQSDKFVCAHQIDID